MGDVVAVLRRITANRNAGVSTASTKLEPVREDVLEKSIPLRRVLRLTTLGDVRPAREALVGSGIAAEPLDGLPAVITAPLDSEGARCIETLIAAREIGAASVIPLWEDVNVVPSTSPLLEV